jgi:type II secretion system protein N
MLRGFRIQKIVFTFTGLIACLWVVWLAIPESLIIGYTKELFKDNDIPVEFSGMKKGVLYTIHVDRVLLNKNPSSDLQTNPSLQSLIPIARNLDMTPDLLSFLRLSPRLNFNGQVNGGTIQGAFEGMFERLEIHIRGENIQVNQLPILEATGIYGNGTLAFHFQWKNDKGEMTFAIDHADLRGTPIGIQVVPLQVFKRVKGILSLSDVVTLNSVSLEGKGIYVRLKGIIREHVYDGAMEVMMDASFDQFSLLQATLKPYQASPGYYVIPLSTERLR